MKKIMFNDRYGLTDMVTMGFKTQTRRLVDSEMAKNLEYAHKPLLMISAGYMSDIEEWKKWAKYPGQVLYIKKQKEPKWEVSPEEIKNNILAKAPYKKSEVLAVAQSYQAAGYGQNMANMAGWRNKMFVKADMMPHKIRITDAGFQRLNEIVEEDCIKEGIVRNDLSDLGLPMKYTLPQGDKRFYDTAKEAYAALIDRVCGKGVWAKNPWVWVFNFELIER